MVTVTLVLLLRRVLIVVLRMVELSADGVQVLPLTSTTSFGLGVMSVGALAADVIVTL